MISQSRERVATETITTPSDEIHSRAERRRKLKRGQNVKRDKRSLWGHDSLAVIKGAATRKPRKGKIMVTMFDVLRQLEKEEGNAAFEIFEWYCKTYDVSGSDEAPASVRFEVFGF